MGRDTGELADFFEQDLKKWIPEIADKFRVTLVEALPTVSSGIRLDIASETALNTHGLGPSKLLQTID